MHVEDFDALASWLVPVLPTMSDADPPILSQYVLALMKKEKSEAQLRELMINQLRVFFKDKIWDFLDLLFEAVRTKEYLHQGGSRRKLSSARVMSPHDLETDGRGGKTRRKNDGSKNLVNRSRRRSPGSSESSEHSFRGRRSRRDKKISPSRLSAPLKRHNSRDEPNNIQARRNEVSDNDGDDRHPPPKPIESVVHSRPVRSSLTFSRPVRGADSRNVITIVQNTEPPHRAILPTPRATSPSRPPFSRPSAAQDDRRQRFRGGRRNFSQGRRVLEVRRIPTDQYSIRALNHHFAQFGNVTSVKLGFDGSSDGALVEFSNQAEADNAYRCPDPVFNNRFVKVFWHDGHLGRTGGGRDAQQHNNNGGGGGNETNTPDVVNVPPTTTTQAGDSAQPRQRSVSFRAKIPNRFTNPSLFSTRRGPAAVRGRVSLPFTSADRRQFFSRKQYVIRRDPNAKVAVARPSDKFKQHHDLLEKLIQEQKSVLSKLEKAVSSAERSSIMQLLSEIMKMIEQRRADLLRLVEADKKKVDEIVKVVVRGFKADDTEKLIKAIERVSPSSVERLDSGKFVVTVNSRSKAEKLMTMDWSDFGDSVTMMEESAEDDDDQKEQNPQIMQFDQGSMLELSAPRDEEFA